MKGLSLLLAGLLMILVILATACGGGNQKAPAPATQQSVAQVGKGVPRFDNPVDLYSAITAGKVRQGTIVEIWGIATWGHSTDFVYGSDNSAYATFVYEKSSTEISKVWCDGVRVDGLKRANIQTGQGGDRIGFRGTVGPTELQDGQSVSTTKLYKCDILLPEMGPTTQWFESMLDFRKALVAKTVAIGTIVQVNGFIGGNLLDNKIPLYSTKDLVGYEQEVEMTCRSGPNHWFVIRGLKPGDRTTVNGEIESVYYAPYSNYVMIELKGCTIVSK